MSEETLIHKPMQPGPSFAPPLQVVATVTTPAPAPLRMFTRITGAVAKEYPQARMRQTGDIIKFVIPAQESLLTPES